MCGRIPCVHNLMGCLFVGNKEKVSLSRTHTHAHTHALSRHFSHFSISYPISLSLLLSLLLSLFSHSPQLDDHLQACPFELMKVYIAKVETQMNLMGQRIQRLEVWRRRRERAGEGGREFSTEKERVLSRRVCACVGVYV